MASGFADLDGIAIDSVGNFYVVEGNRAMIRKVTIAGNGAVTISTVAGAPFDRNYVDGPGSIARFWSPKGIAIDSNGVLYVSDSSGIRKIVMAQNGTATVSTLAGGPSAYGFFSDGTGAFGGLSGATIGSDGMLYVTDVQEFSSRIRRVDPSSAKVTTVPAYADSRYAGYADGNGSEAQFNLPSGVVSDGDGNLYVIDSMSSTVRKVAIASGEVTTLAGVAGSFGYSDGSSHDARFGEIMPVTIDSTGNLYVGDSYMIRKIDTQTGRVSTLALAGVNGAAAPFLPYPTVAADKNGNLYEADGNNRGIRKIVFSTGEISAFAGNSNTGFGSITGLAIDDSGSILYAADSGKRLIRKIDLNTAAVSTLAGSGQATDLDGNGTAASFAAVGNLAVDSKGNVYVTESTGLVRRITPNGTVSTIIGTAGTTANTLGPLPASITRPIGIAIDSTDNLYITTPNAVLTLEP